jgi:hypothetical protein
MTSSYIIKNNEDYERYFASDALSVSVTISPTFFPTRGFNPNLLNLDIHMTQSFDEILNLQLPETLVNLRFACATHVCNVSIPNLSNLIALKELAVFYFNINNFTELPQNLEVLTFTNCVFQNNVQRQMLQPQYLPNKLKSLAIVNCKGLFALPLLPLSLESLNVRGTGQNNLAPIYNRPNLTIAFRYLTPVERHNIINQLNIKTNQIKKERGYGEFENLLMTASMHGNPNVTYAIEMEEELLKQHLGGERATKKRRRKKRKTRNRRYKK